MGENRPGARAAFGLVAAAFLFAAAGCGGGKAPAATQGSGAGASIPTSLPAGATLGCDESPQPACVYGGESAAPKGVYAGSINAQIGVSKFQVSPPLAIVQDKTAPGGEYMALPVGTGSTSAANGQAVVAVNIPQDGYYVVWAATQSGDTTTSTDSFFVGFDQPPSADLDHTWSINPDNQWHIHDSLGGCIQLVHSGPNDAPHGCDTWHFKKGILTIYLDGRESNSHLSWIEVSPANPKQPLPDQRG